MDQNSLLDTFDHVVVLMLENRSFDNVLGYLYQDGVPPGKNFAGSNATPIDVNRASAPAWVNTRPLQNAPGGRTTERAGA